MTVQRDDSGEHGPRGESKNRRLTESATVVIVTYNHRDTIEACLRTALQNDPLEIIVVDNGSTDGTPEFVEREFEEIRLIESEENLGYGRGVQRGVDSAEGDFLVVVNPDARAAPDAFERLLDPLDTRADLIVNPKTVLSDTGRINTCGLTVHFTGLAFVRGYRANPDSYTEHEKVSGFSGVCFAVRKRTYEELGGFDRNIFLYMEDTELSWRATARDVSIRHVPSAVVYHDFDLEVTPEKLYHLEKGRYYILRKYLSWREYCLLGPSFLTTEMLTWGFAVLRGPDGVRQKFKAIADGMTMPTTDVDCDVQDLLAGLDTTIPTDQLNRSRFDGAVKKVANVIYRLNRSLVERVSVSR